MEAAAIRETSESMSLWQYRLPNNVNRRKWLACFLRNNRVVKETYAASVQVWPTGAKLMFMLLKGMTDLVLKTSEGVTAIKLDSLG